MFIPQLWDISSSVFIEMTSNGNKNHYQRQKTCLRTYCICHNKVQRALGSHVHSTCGLQTRKRCHRGMVGSTGHTWNLNPPSERYSGKNVAKMKESTISECLDFPFNSYQKWGYSHKALSVPQLTIGVDNLLLGLEAVPAPSAGHGPQRHDV